MKPRVEFDKGRPVLVSSCLGQITDGTVEIRERRRVGLFENVLHGWRLERGANLDGAGNLIARECGHARPAAR